MPAPLSQAGREPVNHEPEVQSHRHSILGLSGLRQPAPSAPTVGQRTSWYE